MQEELSPSAIYVDRASRQRQENIADIEEMKQSILSKGIINPITVRREGESIILVAGERRLTAALALALPSVPVRFLENLSREEAEVIELEENIKRKELAWRDQVKAIGRIHALYKAQNSEWKIEQTAEAISLHHTQVRKILHVFNALNDPRLAKIEGIEQAYNTLQRFAERKAESIVGDIIASGASIFGTTAATAAATKTTPPPPSSSLSLPSTTTSTSPPASLVISDISEQTQTVLPPAPVLCADFHKWAASYSGPKFSFIHCDFPYGNYKGDDSKGSLSILDTEDFYDNTISVYWNLVNSLIENLDNLMSYSAHLVFWFNMNFYTETVQKLRKAGLMVHDHPLIWHKTGGPGGLGVAPGTAGTHPKRSYDTALLAVRGNRPLVRSVYNSYAAPTVGNKIHPSQKPEPMLRYFFQMFVDETTTMLDPTCGSAASLRAAEDLGAKSVLGLELDPNYVASANQRTLHARVLRQAGKLNRDDI